MDRHDALACHDTLALFLCSRRTYEAITSDQVRDEFIRCAKKYDE